MVVSALALFTFGAHDARARRVRHAWAAVLGRLLVGVSLGLPLYLILRELQGRQAT